MSSDEEIELVESEDAVPLDLLNKKGKRIPSLKIPSRKHSRDESVILLSPGGDEYSGSFEEDEEIVDESKGTRVWNYVKDTYGPVPFADGFPPLRDLPRLLFIELKENWRAGLTVALVSLPLSISLAVASSATPNQGMITAAWSGVIFSIFGGSQFNIVGPTGALSGILSQYAIRYNSAEILSFLSILTAILLFFVLLFRLDKYMMFIPSAVVHGFTLGVALIIGLNQLAGGFGITGLPKPREEFYLNIYEVIRALDRTNPFSVLLFIGTVAGMLLLLRRWPTIPWAIIFAVVGIGLGGVMHLISTQTDLGTGETFRRFRILSLKDKFGTLQPDLFSPVSIDTSWVTPASLSELMYPAFNIMFVAALETLISAKIAAEMTHLPFHQSWEIFAVTLANLFSGVFSGIPTTAALARTSLNIKSGATSRAAGIINGIAIFLISYAVLSVFSFLVQPVVAGIVVVVAIRMVEVQPIIHMIKWDRGGFVVLIVTMLVCLFDNPTDGIIVGSIMALLRMAEWISKLDGHGIVATEGVDIFVPLPLEERRSLGVTPRANESEDTEPDQALLLSIPGDLTYLNGNSWIERAQNISYKFKYVIISLRHLGYIDIDGVAALSQIVMNLEKKSNAERILISGLKKNLHHYKLLKRTKWFHEKKQRGHVFDHYSSALAYLRHEALMEVKRRELGEIVEEEEEEDEEVTE